MKNLILFASITVASGVLFVNLYNSLVDVRSWESNIPNSIAVARDYFKVSNPGNFFRIFSPVNQLLGILALIVFWKYGTTVRIYLGVALVLYLLAEGMTFGFFYPRNDVMFKTAQLTDVDLLRKTVEEWKMMNWVRTLLVLVGISFSYLALQKVFSIR